MSFKTLLTAIAGGSSTFSIIGQAGVLSPFAILSRASAGTTELTQGVYSTAALNEPRYKWAEGKRGLLIEPAATNLLFPSSVAVTKSVAATSQPYTLSFFGSGSVALSGTFTGVVAGTGDTLKEFTFIPLSGLLTLTVSGDVTQWQLETGAVATSRIITTSAAATRAPDVPTIATAAFGFNVSEGTFVCEFITPPVRPAVAGVLIGGDYLSNLYTGDTGQAFYYSGSALVTDPNSSVVGSSAKMAFSYSASGTSLCLNAGAVASSSALIATQSNPFRIGSSQNGQFFLNSVIFSLPYYPRKYTAAELQAAST